MIKKNILSKTFLNDKVTNLLNHWKKWPKFQGGFPLKSENDIPLPYTVEETDNGDLSFIIYTLRETPHGFSGNFIVTVNPETFEYQIQDEYDLSYLDNNKLSKLQRDTIEGAIAKTLIIVYYDNLHRIEKVDGFMFDI